MGKSTILMAIFNSYVKLPEGNHYNFDQGGSSQVYTAYLRARFFASLSFFHHGQSESLDAVTSDSRSLVIPEISRCLWGSRSFPWTMGPWIRWYHHFAVSTRNELRLLDPHHPQVWGDSTLLVAKIGPRSIKCEPLIH